MLTGLALVFTQFSRFSGPEPLRDRCRDAFTLRGDIPEVLLVVPRELRAVLLNKLISRFSLDKCDQHRRRQNPIATLGEDRERALVFIADIEAGHRTFLEQRERDEEDWVTVGGKRGRRPVTIRIAIEGEVETYTPSKSDGVFERN